MCPNSAAVLSESGRLGIAGRSELLGDVPQSPAGSIVSGTRTALEFGTYGPSRVRVEAVDTLGRRTVLLGAVEQGLIHTGYTTHTVVWSLTEWEWDDGLKLWGEHQEFCSARKFRRIARGELPLGV